VKYIFTADGGFLSFIFIYLVFFRSVHSPPTRSATLIPRERIVCVVYGTANCSVRAPVRKANNPVFRPRDDKRNCIVIISFRSVKNYYTIMVSKERTNRAALYYLTSRYRRRLPRAFLSDGAPSGRFLKIPRHHRIRTTTACVRRGGYLFIRVLFRK